MTAPRAGSSLTGQGFRPIDINYLLAREQVSLMLARFAASAATRRTHEGLAQGFGDRLVESVFPHRRTGAGAVAALDLPKRLRETSRG